MATQPLFGLVPAGHPITVTPTEMPSPTSFLYALPGPDPTTTAQSRSFSHVVVFLLPGTELPADTAAAIYLVTPGPAAGAPPNSRFLGGVGPGKESAIFKLGDGGGGGGGSGGGTPVVLGISVEPAASVAARIAELSSSSSSSSSPSAPSAATGGGALARRAPSTLELAQRIIKNAFNFLASFSGTAGQVEVVPLKAFEEWWRRFESKVRTDPGFLERDDDS